MTKNSVQHLLTLHTVFFMDVNCVTECSYFAQRFSMGKY